MSADYYIVIDIPGENQTVYQVPSRGLSIGRGEDCSISIRNREVSRKHFSLRLVGTALFGKDEGSKNGTFVNGVLLDRCREVLLEPGDTVGIAGIAVIVSDRPVLDENTGVKVCCSSGRTLDTILSDMSVEESAVFQKSIPEFLEAIEKIHFAGNEKAVLRELQAVASSWLGAGECRVLTANSVDIPLSREQTEQLMLHPSYVAEKGPEGWSVRDWNTSAHMSGGSLVRALVKDRLLLLERLPEQDLSRDERIKLFHLVVDQAQARIMLHRQSLKLKAQREQKLFPWRLDGESAFMDSLRAWVRQVALTDSTVLVTGDTGTGKEMVARAVHFQSGRASGPFTAVNCAAIPRDLMESELFGHEKGAFTGAGCRRIGRFEQAHTGTLFLDEIGELDVGSQNKLLRVLEERSFSRVGSSVPVSVDVRIIAATNKDLSRERERGRFRDDLFYRLNIMSTYIAPLKDRVEDIAFLGSLFAEELALSLGRGPVKIAQNALEYLRRYDWPGNIRELKNVIERALVLCKGDTLDVTHFPHDIVVSDRSSSISDGTLQGAKNSCEREYIAAAIRQAKGNVSEAARKAGISRQAFHDLLKKHTIDQDIFRT